MDKININNLLNRNDLINNITATIRNIEENIDKKKELYYLLSEYIKTNEY